MPKFIPSIDNPVRKFRRMRFWAVDGYVQIVDDETGQERVIPPTTAILQSNQFLKQAQNMRRREFGNYQDERRETYQLAQDLRECALVAKRQGAPLLAEVAAVETQLQAEYHTALRERAAAKASKPLLFIPGQSEQTEKYDLILPDEIPSFPRLGAAQ